MSNFNTPTRIYDLIIHTTPSTKEKVYLIISGSSWPVIFKEPFNIYAWIQLLIFMAGIIF